MSPKSELAVAVKKQLEALFSEVALSLDKEYKRLITKSKNDISKAFMNVDELSFLLYLYYYCGNLLIIFYIII